MTPTVQAESKRQDLQVGSAIDVLCTFDDEWIPGFGIIELGADGCRIQRLYDREVIPELMALDRVRPA